MKMSHVLSSDTNLTVFNTSPYILRTMIGHSLPRLHHLVAFFTEIIINAELIVISNTVFPIHNI